jgi:two-component system, OmpR family, KDP operon response regulator KdpE
MVAHVLLVGDETALPALLGAAGYRVTVAGDADAALGRVRETAPDILLLDGALPDLDARELVHALRLESDAPLIILSPPGREAETMAALEEGADDYVDAPVEGRALLTRIRVAERRRARIDSRPAHFASGALAIDFAGRRVTVGGRAVRLSPKEYALLSLLARHPGQVVSHRRLLTAGWGAAARDSQYLRVYVGLLRQKIEEDPSDPRLILTEPGIGYRLAAD